MKRSAMGMRKTDLFWMIFLRLVIVTGLAVAAVIIQYSTSTFLPLGPFYLLILMSYALSALYLLLYAINIRPEYQVCLQVFFDLLLITGFVYISGGLQGTFYFLYIFEIIMVSTVLSNRAAYITASLSAICFGVLVDGMYLGLIPAFQTGTVMEISQGLVLNNIFISWSAFFLVAFLTNSLTRRIKRVRAQLDEAKRELAIRQNLDMAGEISASIAHEIRNPLSAVSGSVQVLRSELELDPEQKQLMDIIVGETNRVSQTLEQFLRLACSGDTKLDWFNLSDLLDETVILMKRSGKMNGTLEFKGNFRTAGIRYYGNAYQFKQVFWNIMKNSLKAMPQGGTLTIDIAENENRTVSLRFKDTGRGMTANEQESLFKPFFSRFNGGNGIGMSVVQGIVKEYEGNIQVASEVGRGTEITISLPLSHRNLSY